MSIERCRRRSWTKAKVEPLPVPTKTSSRGRSTRQAQPSRATPLFGEFTTGLATLTAETPYGEIWDRPGLSSRDRSLDTVAAPIALRRTERLAGHLRRAIDNGVTRDELIEVITHSAFHAGRPHATTAMLVALGAFSRRPPASSSREQPG